MQGDGRLVVASGHAAEVVACRLMQLASGRAGRLKAMLRFANQEERFCEILGEPVLVEIVHRDTSHGGVGGMLDPRRIHSFEVHCPHEEECREKQCDCMWARGIHRSQKDPLGLRLPQGIFH